MRTNIAERSFKIKKYRPYNLMTDYLLDIFKEAKPNDGAVCIRSGSRQPEQSFINVSKIKSKLPVEVERHDYRECFFSFATYKNAKDGRRTQDNIANIYAWSVDVDYKNEGVSPLDMYSYIMDSTSIPVPNYIEYGHRLRLIYIFREPLRLFSNNRKSLLAGFNLMQRSIARMINDELSFGENFGAEACPPTSFFRMPGSVNVKNGATVKIKKISSERFTMQEVFEDYIPERYLDESGCKYDWYFKWKRKSRDKKLRHYSQYNLWERRTNLFLDMRNDENAPRKRLLFAYGVGMVQMGKATCWEELSPLLEEFNSGFARPLPTHELKGRYRTLTDRQYKFKDETLAELLELDPEAFGSMSKKERDAERYKRLKDKKIRYGGTKRQKVAARQKRVAVLFSAGKSVSEIAKRLKLSQSTIRRDMAVIKSKFKDTAYVCTERLKNNVRYYKNVVCCAEGRIKYALQLKLSVYREGLVPELKRTPPLSYGYG